MSDGRAGRGRGGGRGGDRGGGARGDRGGGARGDRGAGRGRQMTPTFNPRGRGGGAPTGPSGQGHPYGDQHQRGRGRGDRGDRGDRGGFGRGRGGAPSTEVFRAPEGIPSIDSSVTRIETETEAALKVVRSKTASQKGKVSSLEPQFPQRPGYGTKGREVLLWANYFRMEIKDNLVLHRYSIKVDGQKPARAPTGKKLKRAIQLLLEEHFAQHRHSIVTDSKSNLLSKIKLDIEDEYIVQYRTEDEDEPAPNASSFRVQLQATGTLTVSELTSYLNSSQSGQAFGSKEEILQALNILVGHYPRSVSHITSIGANKHYGINAAATERLDLGAGLTALRGFFVSVRAATARILVNVQVKNVAMYDDGPLVRLMQAFMYVNGPNKFKLWNFTKKLTIDVTHIVKQNRAGQRVARLKRVNGFATPADGSGQEHPPVVPEFGAGSKAVKFFLAAPGAQSSSKPEGSGGASSSKKKGKKKAAGPVAPSSSSEGTYISVYDYFQQNYPQITINEPNLPVINVGDKQNPSYLPPDVCIVLPGQAARSKLTPSQTQQMIRFAVRKPHQNAQTIVTNAGRLLGFDPTNPFFNAFGTQVVPKLITVPGRILNSPDVKYDGNRSASTRFGSWNMNNIKFSGRTQLPYWTYLWISAPGPPDPWRDDNGLKVSIDAFTRELRNVGITAADCVQGMHISVNPSRVESDIDGAIHRFNSNPARPPPKLILIILPGIDTTIYNRVKYACDVKEGILNVCVVASKFARANSQYHANVALKVNLKLGGRNQALDRSKLGILAGGKTMVVGIDVTHPAPGSASNAPSVASIVASTDEWLAQWPAELSIQTGRQEMVADLDRLFKSQLRRWHVKHGVYPANILVYRDGVSEGQYKIVLEDELSALRKACQDLYPATSTKQGVPKFTIVIVGKRHHTRFYATKVEDADRSSNPQNGTVVDRGVTEARNWDFFMQAHAAIQGTARPAHYYVIYDEIFQAQNVTPPFTNVADMVEDLTHNLCYLFGRATKAVSICPPAYYADLACERSRCYLGGLVDASPSGSFAGSVSGSVAGPVVDHNLVKIHANVKDSMFYI